MSENQFIASYITDAPQRRWSLADIAGLHSPLDATPFDRAGSCLYGYLSENDLRWPSLAKSELAHFIGHYLLGERFAISVLERLISEFVFTGQTRSALNSQLDDELLHVEALDTYLNLRLGIKPELETNMLNLCQRSLAAEDARIPLTILHCVVEPFGLGSIGATLKYIHDPVLRNILQRISLDEAQHLSLGSFVSEALETKRDDSITDLVAAGIKDMRASSVSKELLRRYAGADLASAETYAYGSAQIVRQTKHVALAVSRNLRDSGFVINSLKDLFSTSF